MRCKLKRCGGIRLSGPGLLYQDCCQEVLVMIYVSALRKGLAKAIIKKLEVLVYLLLRIAK